MQAVPDKPQSPWKLILIGLLALACGFLTMNFHHILRTTHVHLSLAHHHKTTAFCAFAGCKLGTEGTSTITRSNLLAVAPNSTDAAAAPSSKGPDAAAEAERAAAAKKAKEEAEAKERQAAEQAANTLKAMMTRVCGQPAIDGYAHVVPKCLEDSPTAKWWVEYYAKAGKQGDLKVHIEKQADYDGLAVRWGLGNKLKSVEECAEQCLKHMPNVIDGPFKALPCNAFAYCPDDVCFEPDAHHHTKGDCWLKFTEGPAAPEVNMRGVLPEKYRLRHPNAPTTVQWQSGVLLPAGVPLTNGTWSPRWSW